MAYNAYASIDGGAAKPGTGAQQADGQSMYAEKGGSWLFESGAKGDIIVCSSWWIAAIWSTDNGRKTDPSDSSWLQIERNKERLLEHAVKVCTQPQSPLHDAVRATLKILIFLHGS